MINLHHNNLIATSSTYAKSWLSSNGFNVFLFHFAIGYCAGIIFIFSKNSSLLILRHELVEYVNVSIHLVQHPSVFISYSVL